MDTPKHLPRGMIFDIILLYYHINFSYYYYYYYYQINLQLIYQMIAFLKYILC